MRKNTFRDIYDSKNYRECNKKNFPYIVDIELTNHCNLECRMCSRQIMTRKKGYMKWNIFKKIVDECNNYDTAIRFIRWGEPTLHPHFVRMCKYVKKKRLPLHITTNGLLLTDKLIRDIINIKVDSIIFSMQGATKKGYEIMRGKYYDELKHNIIKFVNTRGDCKRPYTHITSTMYDDSYSEIEKFKEYWKNIVDSVSTGITNMSRLDNSCSPKKIYKPCTEVWQKLSVDWDGKVTICCSDYDNLLTIGDVDKRNLWDIWNNNPILDCYRYILKGMNHRTLTLCKDCYHTYEEF